MSIPAELISTISRSLKKVILKCEECNECITGLDNAYRGRSLNRIIIQLLNVGAKIEESIDTIVDKIIWEYPRLDPEREKLASLFLNSECESIIDIGFRIGASLDKDYSYQFGQREADHKAITDNVATIRQNCRAIIQEIANDEGDLILLIGEYY